MNPKMAIIGAGEFQVPLVMKCRDRGIETHVFSWEKGAVAKDVTDFFYPISILETDQIIAKCREIGVDGVCSIASELAMTSVSEVANTLGLISNSIQSASMTRDKFKMKKAFNSFGVPCAVGNSFSERINAKEFAHQLLKEGSIILKPVDRSGSMAVKKLDGLLGFDESFDLAVKSSICGKVVIERFIDGKEYSIESVSYEGQHQIVAYTEKLTTGCPHFVEAGHFQPANLHGQLKEMIDQVTVDALNALLITNGVSHTEIKIEQGNIWVIEAGGRMGGDFIGSDLTTLSTGIDLVNVSIDIAMGSFLWESIASSKIEEAGVVFLTSDKQSRLIKKNRQVLDRDIIREVIRKKDGNIVEQTTSSCKRFGHIVYKGSKVSQKEVMEHFGLEVP